MEIWTLRIRVEKNRDANRLLEITPIRVYLGTRIKTMVMAHHNSPNMSIFFRRVHPYGKSTRDQVFSMSLMKYDCVEYDDMLSGVVIMCTMCYYFICSTKQHPMSIHVPPLQPLCYVQKTFCGLWHDVDVAWTWSPTL